MIGTKFDRWTTLSDIYRDEKTGKKVVLCKCECGFEKTVILDMLTSGQSKGCKACFRKRWNAPYFKRLEL